MNPSQITGFQSGEVSGRVAHALEASLPLDKDEALRLSLVALARDRELLAASLVQSNEFTEALSEYGYDLSSLKPAEPDHE